MRASSDGVSHPEHFPGNTAGAQELVRLDISLLTAKQGRAITAHSPSHLCIFALKTTWSFEEMKKAQEKWNAGRPIQEFVVWARQKPSTTSPDQSLKFRFTPPKLRNPGARKCQTESPNDKNLKPDPVQSIQGLGF